MSVRLSDWLLPYQRRFAEAPQKRKIYLSARQAGKSFVLAYMALKKALTNPAQAVLCISTGQRAASEFLQKVARWADAAKIASSGALDFQASADCVKLGNGGRVLSLPSGNPSALRGYTAPLVVIDEAAYLENADEVFQAIAPTLTRNKDAELVVASTPAGCAGLFWDLWCQAEADPGWYRQTTTIEDAVAEGLDVDVEELKALCPDPAVFDVEYMCRFSKEVGSFVDPGAVVYEDPARPGGRYVLGADFGRKNDATAFAVLRDFGDKAFLEDVVTMTGADWES